LIEEHIHSPLSLFLVVYILYTYVHCMCVRVCVLFFVSRRVVLLYTYYRRSGFGCRVPRMDVEFKCYYEVRVPVLLSWVHNTNLCLCIVHFHLWTKIIISVLPRLTIGCNYLLIQTDVTFTRWLYRYINFIRGKRTCYIIARWRQLTADPSRANVIFVHRQRY